MKRILSIIVLLAFVASGTSCAKPVYPSGDDAESEVETESYLELAERNLLRSITLFTEAKSHYVSGPETILYRQYNPFNDWRSEEKGSAWMYSNFIQSLNGIIDGMIALKDAGRPAIYDKNYETYTSMLSDFVLNMEFYAGTFTLTSYTQTKDWTVYGVNRSASKGQAQVEGVMNVYDDNEWIVIELLNAFDNTGNRKYFEKAEYLTEYILDGWDTTLDEKNVEYGGITWGPGYYTKHSCSNGPMIAPLVYLAQYYAGKPDQIEYRYIGKDKERLTKQMLKSEYYTMYAEKVYEFQKKNLYRESDGVYWDMLGADGFQGDHICYEEVGGVRYRGHNKHQRPVGQAYSYNSGTMLSGAAKLYMLTGKKEYYADMTKLSASAFRYFAKRSSKGEGLYVYDCTSWNPCFNLVLLQGWFDVSEHYNNVDKNISSFQNNLDYAYEHYLKNNMLPTNLLEGWNPDKNNNITESLTTFSYIAQYALLTEYQIQKISK